MKGQKQKTRPLVSTIFCAYDYHHNQKWGRCFIFGEIYYLKYTGFILLLAFVAQTFSKTFIVAGYYANTAAYAKNCENKAKPKMNCNGKCQVMKKLQQEEKQDKQNPDRKTDNKEEVLSSKTFFTTLHCSIPAIKTLYPLLDGSKAAEMPRSIFHPPGNRA